MPGAHPAVTPVQPTLIVNLVFAAASAAVFAMVGWTVQKRKVSADARLGRTAFMTWWYGLAIVTLVGPLTAIPPFTKDVDLFIVATVLSTLVICAALWGLLVYLIFLFTSNRRVAWPLGAGYLGYFAFLVYYILKQDPTGVEVTRWGARLVPQPPTTGWSFWLTVIFLLAPQLLGALAYLTLYWRVDQPILRKRILLVSTSILVWFGSAAVTVASTASAAPGTEQPDWIVIMGKIIGLAAALTIFYAFVGLKEHAEPSGEILPPAS